MPPYEVSPSTSRQDRLRLLEGHARRGAAVGAYLVPAGSLPPRMRAAAVLRAVQRLPYRSDPRGLDGKPIEQFQSVESTYYGGGDCDDLAALLVAGLRAAGVRARLVWMELDGNVQNHITVQASYDPPSVPADEASWEWMEPTIEGAMPGEYPLDAARRLGNYRSVS